MFELTLECERNKMAYPITIDEKINLVMYQNMINFKTWDWYGQNFSGLKYKNYWNSSFDVVM